jgi:predicted porin
MQKKLLTIAVAAALAAPAAMADVTVYGQMHYSYDYVSALEDEGATGVSRESRIGFKGAEDLGGGLKGVWQIEMKVGDEAPDYAGETQFRNTFVGLAGGFGTVLAGRHDTPYKISTGKLDPFADRAADYNQIMGTISVPTVTLAGRREVVTPVAYTTSDERAPQTIAYITPNMNGFSGALAYVDHYFTNIADESDTAFSGMLMYDNAGFFAAAAYEYGEGTNLAGVLAPNLVGNLETTTATGLQVAARLPAAPVVDLESPALESWKIGLGYTFGGFTIGGIYENIEVSADNAIVNVGGRVVEQDVDDLDRDAWYLTGQYAFGPNVIKAMYGQADDFGDIDDTGADVWAIGYDYNFSKRTTLYALYNQLNNDDNASYSANSGQGVGSAYSNPGDDVDVFSVGVIHKF